jgi:hypothetical protein
MPRKIQSILDSAGPNLFYTKSQSSGLARPLVRPMDVIQAARPASAMPLSRECRAAVADKVVAGFDDAVEGPVVVHELPDPTLSRVSSRWL